MQVFVGTSGFSYPEWVGSFYPEDLASSQFLHYYAQRFPSVEINNTFYRKPKVATLEKWANHVPEAFRFVLKAPQRITHLKRLKDVAEETEYFFKTASVLGPRLGPVLFQLPPFLRKDLPRLEAFLQLLPQDTRSAFEFRHETWLEADTYELLRKYGAALCTAEEEDLQAPMVATASFGYLRLRLVSYDDKDLSAWAKKLQAQNWRQAYVFFRHENAGTGPQLARRFAELAG